MQSSWLAIHVYDKQHSSTWTSTHGYGRSVLADHLVSLYSALLLTCCRVLMSMFEET